MEFKINTGTFSNSDKVWVEIQGEGEHFGFECTGLSIQQVVEQVIKFFFTKLKVKEAKEKGLTMEEAFPETKILGDENVRKELSKSEE